MSIYRKIYSCKVQLIKIIFKDSAFIILNFSHDCHQICVVLNELQETKHFIQIKHILQKYFSHNALSYIVSAKLSFSS